MNHDDHRRHTSEDQSARATVSEAEHINHSTHGQAMPEGRAHSAVDEEHAVHQHGQHAGHSTAMFKNKFSLSLLLSAPVVYFSPMFAHLLGYHIPDFPGSTWIPPVLGSLIYVYGGTPFLKGGWTELRGRQPGMMLCPTASQKKR